MGVPSRDLYEAVTALPQKSVDENRWRNLVGICVPGYSVGECQRIFASEPIIR